MASTASGRAPGGRRRPSAVDSTVNPAKASGPGRDVALVGGERVDAGDAAPVGVLVADDLARPSPARRGGAGTTAATVTTCSRGPGPTSSVAMLVMTSPVGATSGAKCGQRTSEVHGAASSSVRRALRPPIGSASSDAVGRAAPGERRRRAARPASASALRARRRRSSSRGHGRRPTRRGRRDRQQAAGVADHLGQGAGVGRRAPGVPRLMASSTGQAEPLVARRERHGDGARARRPARRAAGSGRCAGPGRPGPCRAIWSRDVLLGRALAAGEHERDVGLAGRDRGERPQQQGVVLVGPGDRREHEPPARQPVAGLDLRRRSPRCVGGVDAPRARRRTRSRVDAEAVDDARPRRTRWARPRPPPGAPTAGIDRCR